MLLTHTQFLFHLNFSASPSLFQFDSMRLELYVYCVICILVDRQAKSIIMVSDGSTVITINFGWKLPRRYSISNVAQSNNFKIEIIEKNTPIRNENWKFRGFSVSVSLFFLIFRFVIQTQSLVSISRCCLHTAENSFRKFFPLMFA